MPYIPQEDRELYDEEIDTLVEVITAMRLKPGHVNYVVYAFLLRIFKAYPKYTTINIIDGVLNDVGKELYRKHFGPYEDKAINKNGDIE